MRHENASFKRFGFKSNSRLKTLGLFEAKALFAWTVKLLK